MGFLLQKLSTTFEILAENMGAHFNLDIGMLEQLKGRMN
jgi:hypothetical protein